MKYVKQAFVILAFATNYPADTTFTLANLEKTFDMKADTYLINSLLLALGTAVIGTAVSFITAYMTARMKSRASRFLHLSSITSAAIPGVVLGLSYVLAFKGSAVYGTLMILIMANLIHFIASPYLMMYNSLSKLNENLEDVGHTMNISRAKMIRDVFIPQCKGTLLEMFSYFFVNSMMTISAVAFLASSDTKPLSLMISQFEASMNLECIAVVSLLILLVNLIIKAVVHICKGKKMKLLLFFL